MDVERLLSRPLTKLGPEMGAVRTSGRKTIALAVLAGMRRQALLAWGSRGNVAFI